MAGIQIDFSGKDEVEQRLAQTAAKLDDPRPMYDAIGALLQASTLHRFESQKDPEGNLWPASIRVQLFGGTTLTDTGFLRNSITFEADAGGVAVGTNAIYAATHQFGATIRPVKAGALAFEIGGVSVFAQQVEIPRRAFLGLDDADQDAIYDAASDFAFGPLTGAEAVR